MRREYYIILTSSQAINFGRPITITNTICYKPLLSLTLVLPLQRTLLLTVPTSLFYLSLIHPFLIALI